MELCLRRRLMLLLLPHLQTIGLEGHDGIYAAAVGSSQVGNVCVCVRAPRQNNSRYQTDVFLSVKRNHLVDGKIPRASRHTSSRTILKIYGFY